MEKRAAKYPSHEAAEKADRAYYLSLTPEERMRIFLEILERGRHGASERLEKVYRVVKLPGR